jgi:hypothetical protein
VIQYYYISLSIFGIIIFVSSLRSHMFPLPRGSCSNQSNLDLKTHMLTWVTMSSGHNVTISARLSQNDLAN